MRATCTLAAVVCALTGASAFTPATRATRMTPAMAADSSSSVDRRSLLGVFGSAIVGATAAAQPTFAYDPRNVEAAKNSAPRGGGTTTPAPRGMGGGLKFNPDASMYYGRLPVPVYGARDGTMLGNTYEGISPKETETYNNLPWMTSKNGAYDGIDRIMSFSTDRGAARAASAKPAKPRAAGGLGREISGLASERNPTIKAVEAAGAAQ